jgi:hypothetical protein
MVRGAYGGSSLHPTVAVPQPVADELLPLEERSVEWWREYDLAQLRYMWCRIEEDKRELRHLYDVARYTWKGDPDATDAERQEAETDARNAIGWLDQAEYEQSEIEDEAERVKSTPPPPSYRPPSERSIAPANGRLRIMRVARPRERRARPVRRSSSRAGPDSDSSDSEGEPEPVARRRRGWAP